MMEGKVMINIDKNKLIRDLLSLINGPDRCSICAFEEQQKGNDSEIPVCNICVNGDCWELSESVLATIIESSLTVTDTTVETEIGACSKRTDAVKETMNEKPKEFIGGLDRWLTK